MRKPLRLFHSFPLIPPATFFFLFMRFTTPFALAFAAAALSLGTAQAQSVANLNLETWSIRPSVPSGVEAPQNWLTDDDLFGPVMSSYGTLSKTPVSHSGTYAAKLVTDATNTEGYFALGTKVGTNPTAQQSYGGLPFTGRPANFQFYYKLTSAAAAADSAFVLLELTRTVSGASETVGYATKFLDNPAATNYTLASLPIVYDPAITAAPDSVHILFISGLATGGVTAGNGIYIDDINLGTTTATHSANLNRAVMVLPNPSAGGRFVLRSAEAALLAAPFTVTDLAGRVVLREPAARPSTERLVDLSRQAAGIYTLQLATERGLVVQKLVVE